MTVWDVERGGLPRANHAHKLQWSGAIGAIGSTTNTAASLIDDMVEHGVLVEVTGQRRNRLFLFQDYLDLFKG